MTKANVPQATEIESIARDCVDPPFGAKELFDSVNNLVVRHPKLVEAKRWADLFVELGPFSDEAPCSEICGPAGIGKSTLWEWLNDGARERVDWCEFRLPKRPPGRVLRRPYLTIKLQQQPTVGKICDEFLRALGDPLWWQGSVVDKTARVDILLHAAQTHVVYIDEFQYVVDRTGVVVSEDIVDWLRDRHMPASRARLDLPCARSICLCLLGLGRLSAIFSGDGQRLRRWDAGWRMEAYGNSGPDLDDFASIVAAFLDATLLPVNPAIDPSDPDLVRRFHYATWGVSGYVKKLFGAAMRLAAFQPERYRVLDQRLLSDAFALQIRTEEFELVSRLVAVGDEPSYHGMQNPFSDNFNASSPPPALTDDRAPLPAPETRRRRAETRRDIDDAVRCSFRR